jgi:hypothetical protein
MRRSTRYNRPGLSGSSRSALLLNNDGDGSTLTLDFTTGILDSRLTFQRLSDATFINSSGLVQYADANHIRNSTMLVSTSWTQTTTGTGATTINGDGSVRFNGAGGRVTWLQSVGLANALEITFSFRVTAFTNTNLRTSDLYTAGFGFTGQQYFYTDTNGTTHSLTAFESLPKSGTDGLGVYTCTATTTATSCNVIFGVDCNGIGRLGDVTIRDPQVQYGTVVPRLSYVPNSNTGSAKWDSPRFDYDPATLTARGLLIEGQSANTVLNSESFPSTGTGQWGYTNLTANATKITSPNGTANAIQFNETTANALHRITQGITGSAGPASVSVWAKVLDPANPRRLFLNAIGFMNASALFDLDPATQTGASGTAVSVAGTAPNRAGTWVKYPNGWYRCTVVGTYNANTSLFLQVNRASSTTPNDDTYAGSTTNGLALWGVQAEYGTTSGSYIPTGTSTATRAADFCLMTGTNFSSWYQGGTQGTFYADWFGGVREGASGSTNRTVLSTDDVANKHLHLMQTAAAGNLRLRDFGGANQITTANTLTSGARTKGAFGYNGSSASVCLNGGTVATGSSLSFSVAPTWLVIGATSTNGTSLTDANVVLNNSIRQIKYWPTRLPDSTIQNLTL